MNDDTPPRSEKDSHYARLRREYRDRHATEKTEPLRLYGLHTVDAAIANPRRTIHRLRATRNAAQRLSQRRDGLEPEIVEPKLLDRLVGSDAVHQGVVADVAPLPERRLGDLSSTDLVLVLDRITDPHNVGAILRSAVAMKAGAVVMTARHAPNETMVLAKAASGALEHVDIIRVRNLSETIESLRTDGFTTVGLDSDGVNEMEQAMTDGPIALVLGAEGKGLRQRTRETVDVLARLDMPGPIRSLNVSNAAALSLYVARRHLNGVNRNSAQSTT